MNWTGHMKQKGSQPSKLFQLLFMYDYVSTKVKQKPKGCIYKTINKKKIA